MTEIDKLSLTARAKASRTWRHQLEERRCFVCQQAMPTGTAFGWLQIGYHEAYGAVVHAHLRDYERSPRGRWRPRWEILARVAAAGDGVTSRDG